MRLFCTHDEGIMTPLITLKDIRLSFGGTPLFEGVTLSLQETTKACLVGRNGSGKSTLLKLIAQIYEPDDGDLFLKPSIRIAYLPQNPDFKNASTLLEYVQQGLPDSEKTELFRCEEYLDLVGLDKSLDINNLSGGEARRADLARAMVSEPDLLLLDEPTNHLDIETILWLESFLKTFRKALLVISHDRTFLKHITNKTLWLDRGTVKELNKGFGYFEEWSATILDQEERERSKLTKKIEEETRWSHQGITARRKRNQGRLRRLQTLRQERARQGGQERILRLQAEEGTLSGKVVVETHHLSKSFGEKVIVKDFTTRILRGDRIGFVGPNGVGKSTLLKLLTGRLKADSGKIKMGSNLTPLYIDQNRSALDPEKTLWETLCDKGGDQIMVQGTPRHVVGYLKDFLFSTSQVRSPVGSLSGGEQNRLLLAQQLARPSNLLILDEPTNDLDVESLDLLEEILSDYTGTIFLVSHDRDFLDRLVTSTFLMEGSGRIIEYAGGYTDALRQKSLGNSAREHLSEASSHLGKKNLSTEKKNKPKDRLGYKEKWRLENLPNEISKQEIHVEKIKEQLEDPALYQKDPEKFTSLSRQLETQQKTLEELEAEWLSLEEKRETFKEK